MHLLKHCNTCAYSYKTNDRESPLPLRKIRQHCSNTNYNSPEYTHEMLMQDWNSDHCRFWTPREERNAA